MNKRKTQNGLPNLRILRRMGYLVDQDGIVNRYIREKEHWDPHLEQCRAFILESLHRSHAESVAILGSGWLLDVPLTELNQRMKKIYLVDIHHPPQVRHRVRDMRKVELVEEDLTGGGIREIWNLTRRRNRKMLRNRLETMRFHQPLTGLSPGFLVSLSLLDQLDILLTDYLQKFDYFQQPELDRFRKKIQDFHLRWITSRPGCLITDTREVHTGTKGEEISNSLLYTDLPPGKRHESWTWNFDSRGMYREGFTTNMEVQAIDWGH